LIRHAITSSLKFFGTIFAHFSHVRILCNNLVDCTFIKFIGNHHICYMIPQLHFLSNDHVNYML
jgi:hypothetical protein